MKAHTEKIMNALARQDNTLRDMRERLDEVDKGILAGQGLLLKLARAARTDWLVHIGQEVKVHMLKIIAINLR